MTTENKTTHRRSPRPLLLVIAAIIASTSACAFTRSGPDISTITLLPGSAGCIYIRALAHLAGEGSILITGTWGDRPPSFKDCWASIPQGLP